MLARTPSPHAANQSWGGTRGRSGAGGDSSLHFADRLVDQTQRGNPMATLVGFGDLQFGPGVLQRSQSVLHVRLRRNHTAAGKAHRSDDHHGNNGQMAPG